MTIKELMDILTVLSNQYYVGKENLVLTEKELGVLVPRALQVYSQYNPKQDLVTISVNFGKNFIRTLPGSDGKERIVQGIRALYLAPPYIAVNPIEGWNYNRQSGLLTIQYGGTLYADILFTRLLDDITYEIDREFFDLLLGLFFMAIAEPRKGFNLSDLPFENDANELYQIGAELYSGTIERMKEKNSEWYLGIV